MEVHVEQTAESAAEFAAGVVARSAERAVDVRGEFFIAVSGGHTPWAMFQRLRTQAGFPWERAVFYQVDERIVSRDDPDRNLAHLVDALPDGTTIHAMPVDDDDLEAACARYAASLPEMFDLVHLGLGDDGHTASLVPGDPVLEVRDRLVALTMRSYMGHRRMTLTYPALAKTRELLWLVAGVEKQMAVSRLLEKDKGIPAGAVEAPHQMLVADEAALS